MSVTFSDQEHLLSSDSEERSEISDSEVSDSSPLEESDGEIEDPETDVETEEVEPTKFVIRLTPGEFYTFENVQNWLLEKYPEEPWVIATELEPNKHFHIVLTTALNLSEMKECIVEHILKYKRDPETGKLPRGAPGYDCRIAMTEAETRVKLKNKYYYMMDRAVSYCLKDQKRADGGVRKFKAHGYTPEYIEKCIAEGYPRNKKSTMISELRKLKEDYMGSEMTEKEFMIKYMDLKGAVCDQPVRLMDAEAQTNSMYIKKYGDGSENLYNNYFKHREEPW